MLQSSGVLLESAPTDMQSGLGRAGSLSVGKTNEDKTPIVTVMSESIASDFCNLSHAVMLGESYLFANSTSGRQPVLNKLSDLTKAANEIKEVQSGGWMGVGREGEGNLLINGCKKKKEREKTISVGESYNLEDRTTHKVCSAATRACHWQMSKPGVALQPHTRTGAQATLD